jgi:alanine-glyoxylate transaminase / (R)-3-amino-2-methylpropionate-pyruvate transaminase
MGLMQGLELVKNRNTKEPAPEATSQFMELCRNNGLLVGKGGLFANVIRLAPPLNIQESDVDVAIETMDAAFARVGLGS